MVGETLKKSSIADSDGMEEEDLDFEPTDCDVEKLIEENRSRANNVDSLLNMAENLPADILPDETNETEPGQTDDEFKEILNGVLPDGASVDRAVEDEKKHRAETMLLPSNKRPQRKAKLTALQQISRDATIMTRDIDFSKVKDKDELATVLATTSAAYARRDEFGQRGLRYCRQ